MAVIKELIRKENNGSISFGNYELPQKTKLADFEVNGDFYKVKTFKEITKLEKEIAASDSSGSGTFVYESIPGTAVSVFKETADEVSFFVDGKGQTQITLELESNKEYRVFVGDRDLGVSKTDVGGKITLDVDLENGNLTTVKVVTA